MIRAMSNIRIRTLCAALVLAALVASPAAGQQPAPRTSAMKYRDAAARLIGAALTDQTAWRRLAWLSDTIGPRLSGSPQLEAAIRWAVDEMKKDGLDNVRAEKVMVPHWVRGEESLELLEPRAERLAMLGLGNSVGTPPEGVAADVVVVRNFDELEALGASVRGKIVLFNVPFTTYGETVQYRGSGPSRAAKLGAVGALVRSVGPVSLQTPHTGATRYADDAPKIPAAAVTIETAEMMARMQKRGQRIRARLRMSAHFLPDAESANVVAEVRGSELPEEIVLISGHYDSWDVGQGSTDDAGGCIAAWEAARLIKQLGFRPRRTIRVVLYTNEENGLRGGTEYARQHAAEIKNHVLAIESDSGVFKPWGFGFTGTDEGRAMVREIAELLEGIEASRIEGEGTEADIGPLVRLGVPGMGLRVDGERYFHIHHTHADTLDKINPNDFARCVAAFAVMAYVAADMPERIPFGEPQAPGAR